MIESEHFWGYDFRAFVRFLYEINCKFSLKSRVKNEIEMIHLGRLIVSYNCTGLLYDRKEFIKETLLSDDVDFVFLQETWLHQNDLSELSNISNKYLSCGVSGFSGRDILQGRPYGGVGILGHTSLAHKVKAVKSICNRICCVKLHVNEHYSALINVYICRVTITEFT